MTQNTRLALALSIILAGLLAVGGYLTYLNKNQLGKSIGQISQNETANNNLELKLEQKPEYVVRDFIYQGNFDTQIYDQANKRIFVSSTVQLCGTALDLYAQPSNSNLIYLITYNPGTDNPNKDIYSLNQTNLECSRLSISDNIDDFGAKILSPDQNRIALALESEPTRLKLITLSEDSIKVLVNLKSGETLNGGGSGLSTHTVVRWTDSQTITYVVYQDTDQLDPKTGLKPFLEERTVKTR